MKNFLSWNYLHQALDIIDCFCHNKNYTLPNIHPCIINVLNKSHHLTQGNLLFDYVTNKLEDDFMYGSYTFGIYKSLFIPNYHEHGAELLSKKYTNANNIIIVKTKLMYGANNPKIIKIKSHATGENKRVLAKGNQKSFTFSNNIKKLIKREKNMPNIKINGHNKNPTGMDIMNFKKCLLIYMMRLF